MPYNDLDYEELTQILADNFRVLADEVQLLSDRKTILEHKVCNRESSNLKPATDHTAAFVCTRTSEIPISSPILDLAKADEKHSSRTELLSAIKIDKHHVS